MKYGISIGHNSPPDIGAVNGYEDELNKELGLKVAAGLTKIGHDVIIVNPSHKVYSVSESLKARCKRANEEKVDKYLSIHFNAFNGKAYGTETFYVSEAGRKIAVPILDEIIKLSSNGYSFKRRGAKRIDKFYELNATNMPACLVEVCFCDNPQDMKIYQNIGSQQVAEAIIKGLTGRNFM